MKSPKFYKSIIIALVLLNIATLAFMWFGRPPHPPHPEDLPPIATKLGITGEDAVKVGELEKKHHKTKRTLVDKDMDLHENLYKAIGTETDSQAILDEIADNKQEIEKMTFDFFDEIAGYCNEDQKNELREFVHGAFQQLRPKPKND